MNLNLNLNPNPANGPQAYRARAWGLAVLLSLLMATAQGQQTPTRPGSRGPSLDDVRGRVEEPVQRPEEPPGRRTGPRQQGGPDAQVRSVEGESAGVRVIAGEGAFEPTLYIPVEYGQVPSTEGRVQLSSAGPMPATQFLDELALATGWNIAATPTVQETTLIFFIKRMSPEQAVAVLRFNDLYYEYDADSGFLFVSTLDEHLSRTHGQVMEREFDVNYANLADVEGAMAALLSPAGRLIADPATSKVLVIDTRENLRHMERVLLEMDVPRQARAFELAHVNADALFDSVETMLSERGTMHVDPRSNMLIVMDRPDRLGEIEEVVRVLDRQLEARSWTLDYADPLLVAEQVALFVPEEMGTIEVHEEIHQITVTATPYRLDQIDERIESWDRPRRQVKIEAYLVTATTDKARNLGINWQYIDEHGDNAFAFQVGDVSNVFNLDNQPGQGQRLHFMDTDLSAVLDFLETEGDIKILAHPTITVQDGEEASFENVTQVPFTQSTTRFGATDTDNLNTVSTIDFIDVGTVLRVLPRISRDDNILMDIRAEDSSFIIQEFVSNGLTNQAPQKTQNVAETQVLVNDEETIVLGGLRTANFNDSIDKIPVLGDIPWLGRIFRTSSKDHSNTELLIFMTPTIVDTFTQPEAERLAAFDQELATDMRTDDESAFRRARRYATDGESEIAVAIGQTGSVYVDGQLVSTDGLDAYLRGIENPGSKTVVVRTHPRAPAHVSARVTAITMNHEMNLKFDKRSVPFVPAGSIQGELRPFEELSEPN